MTNKAVHNDRLKLTLAGIALRNPVMLAAGTSGTLDEFGDVMRLAGLGGVTSKSITAEPRLGNPTWRILPERAGMLNAIGLANPGIDAFEAEYLPRAQAMSCATVISVAGFSIDEYAAVCASVDGWHDRGVDAIELNVSCPNVRTGTEFGQTPQLITELISAVRPQVSHLPLFVKLSPMAPDLHVIARAAADAGASALTIANTAPAMAIDVMTRRPRLSNTTGGLSGPALHPITLRLVHDVYRNFARDAGVPIIACGGVMRWQDAAAYILAGASAVQMGTALYADPRSPRRVVRGLSRWVHRLGRSNITELIGDLEAPEQISHPVG